MELATLFEEMGSHGNKEVKDWENALLYCLQVRKDKNANICISLCECLQRWGIYWLSSQPNYTCHKQYSSFKTIWIRRTTDIHTHICSWINNTIITVNNSTLNVAPVPLHPQHLQLRKVYYINLTSIQPLLIMIALFSLISSSINSNDSPLQANNPNNISVRLGRSISHCK